MQALRITCLQRGHRTRFVPNVVPIDTGSSSRLNSELSELLDYPTVPLTTDHTAIPNIPVIFPIRGQPVFLGTQRLSVDRSL